MNDQPSTQPDLAKAVDQLRTLVCGLGVILFLLSIAFTGFVWKQCRMVSNLTLARREQLIEMKGNVDQMGSVINDLLIYSNGRPELMAIFRNHGVEVKPAATPPPAAPQR